MNRIIVLSLTLLLTIQCVNETGNTIFGTSKEAITITNPADGGTLNTGESFQFTVPEDMKFGVIGLFGASIVVDEYSILMTNSDWLYGNRTGLSGYTAGTVPANAVYSVNTEKTDFDASGFANVPANSTVFWAVWGYDKYGNLNFASESRQVTIK